MRKGVLRQKAVGSLGLRFWLCVSLAALVACSLPSIAQDTQPAQEAPAEEPARPAVIPMQPSTATKPRAPKPENRPRIIRVAPPAGIAPGAPQQGQSEATPAIPAAVAAPGATGDIPPENAVEHYYYCNQTSYLVLVSMGIRQGQQSMTRGWWPVNPGECKIVLKGPLDPTAYYTFARSHFVHSGPARVWGGNHLLCVGRGQFQATSDGTGQCGPGLESQSFAKIETGGRLSWKTTLTEGPAIKSLDMARIAGVQRLLSDLGYDVGTINGDASQRFRQILAAARGQYSLPDDADMPSLYSKLLAEAAKVQLQTGLSMCNRTAEPLWFALGLAREGRRSSKGWWRIQPNECEKIIKDRLADRFIFAYAASESSSQSGLRWDGTYIFCTRDAVFDLDGGDNCENRSARSTGFFAIDTGGRVGAVFQFTQETATNAR